MDLPSELIKCVAFVVMRKPNGDDELVGTCFFLSRSAPKGKKRLHYVVTARHVIDGICENGGLLMLRVNLETSGATVLPVEGRWYSHDDLTVDLAIAYLGSSEEVNGPDEIWDHVSLPWTLFEPIPVNGRDPRHIALGDDVVMMGLFHQHYGLRGNIPIVRLGSIAALPAERVSARLGTPGYPKQGDIEAFLVETRSQSGLSGSPAFVIETRYENVRSIIADHTLITPRSHRRIYFLGLVRGHFDEKLAVVEAPGSGKNLNLGIATVVPYSQLVDLFSSDDIREFEQRL